MYIEPWSNCHDNSNYEEDKVRIFVSGPSPEMGRKFKHHSGIEDKPVKKNKSTSYKSTGPNDERFYGKLIFFLHKGEKLEVNHLFFSYYTVGQKIKKSPGQKNS